MAELTSVVTPLLLASVGRAEELLLEGSRNPLRLATRRRGWELWGPSSNAKIMAFPEILDLVGGVKNGCIFNHAWG